MKPVAWMWKDGTLTADPDYADGTWTPLYAAPVHANDISQERVDETSKRKDEPVVWIKDDEIAFMSAARMLGATEWKTNLGLKPEHGDVPLYTAPPKREWVGLTDEDLIDIGKKYYGNSVDAMLAIEAKLKEKNT